MIKLGGIVSGTGFGKSTSTKGSIAEKGGVSSAGVKESSHEETEEENQVDKMFNDIKEGSGWSTADYITNSAHINLSERERAQLLFKLAEGGMLVDETTLKGTEKEFDELDENCFMNIQDVKSKYNEIKGRYDKGKVEETKVIKKSSKLSNILKESTINENPYLQAVIANQMVQNPVTKKQVKLSTAAFNPDHPAHKKAKSILQRIMDKIKGKNEVVNETKFIAFYQGKQHEIEGKDLWDAQKKAIAMLKVPKSKQGMLAVKSANYMKNQEFRYEAVNEDEKTVYKKGKGLFVDSDFVNSSKGKLPNSELKHAGYGDFFLDTPNGKVYFIRTSEKFDGMSGRAHRITDNEQNGKLVAQLIKKMGAKIVQ